MDAHPELQEILTDFLASVLVHQPDDVFAFAKTYNHLHADNNTSDRNPKPP